MGNETFWTNFKHFESMFILKTLPRKILYISRMEFILEFHSFDPENASKQDESMIFEPPLLIARDSTLAMYVVQSRQNIWWTSSADKRSNSNGIYLFPNYVAQQPG